MAWANFYLKHDGTSWKPVAAEVTMKYGDRSAIAPPLAYDEASAGPIFLDMDMEEAVRALGGNPDDYGESQLERGEIEINGVRLGGTYSLVSWIVLSTSQYATSRGLRVGDSAETLEKYYGMPDVGRFEDGSVTWYFTAGVQPTFHRQMVVTLKDGRVKTIEFCQYYND